MQSEGIYPGGPDQSLRRARQDCVYCSCNDPSAIKLGDEVQSAIVVSHSCTRFVAGLMMPIPAYKYLKDGCMIHWDSISFQEGHPYVTCYIAGANCLMIPYLVDKRYVVQILDIRIGFIKYHNKAGWDTSIDVMRIKYREPPIDATTLPALGFAAGPTTYPTSCALVNEVIHHDDSFDGSWTEDGPDPSNAIRKQIPIGFQHVAKH